MKRTDILVIDPSFQIELPSFEGPLDLLLHLIQKHELDILDLPISFITQEYVNYVEMMENLNLDIASEYLVMAAELARIKSKMLVPKSPHDEDEDELEEEIDPRGELIQRLLEYQKYKRAANELFDRSLEGRDVFTRGAPMPKEEGPAPLAQFSVFKLIDAFQGIIKRISKEMAFEISAERISIQERITEITDKLRVRKRCKFEDLFAEDKTTYELVVTFMAVLEMAKMRITRVFQIEAGSPIYLEYRLLEENPDAGNDAEKAVDPNASSEKSKTQSTEKQPEDTEQFSEKF